MDPISCPFCKSDIHPRPGKLEQASNTYILAWDYRCGCGDYRKILPNEEDKRWRNVFTDAVLGAAD